MKRRLPQTALFRLALILLAAGLWFPSVSADDKASAISRMRIRKITEVIRRYQMAGENLGDPDVKAAIFQEIAENFPLEPQGNPNRTSTRDIAKAIREKVAEKFPDELKEVEHKARAEAEPRFAMHNILDYVMIRYEQGRKTYDIEGIFYSYGKGGNSINIGGLIVPIFDLLPEFRVKFDKSFNEIQKKEFIQDRIRNYFRRKTQYSSELFNEIRSQITQENEKDGWIFAWNDWRTPKDVTEQIISGILTNNEQKEPSDTPEDTPPADPAAGNGETPGQDPDTLPPSGDSLPQRIVEAKRRAEQKKIIVANTFTGIDADQGYGLAIWGMPREEVALLFHPEISLESRASVEDLKYTEGAVESVQLFFLNDILYRAVVVFRVAHNEAMQLLWRRISESYGESREEAVERAQFAILRDAAEAILATMASTPVNCDQLDPPADHEYEEVSHTEGEGETAVTTVIGRVCKKCGTVEPKAIPMESIFTWEGEVTAASLNVRLSPDLATYQLFQLTKENPKLRQRIEAEINQDRLRRAEEERRRREEQYREPIKF
jgi:hypothetical protein